jgi:four helix bundle protein
LDLKLRSQITDAAGSVCRNIVEGFRRRSHREFARYLDHATGSLASAPIARMLRYLRRNPDRS